MFQITAAGNIGNDAELKEIGGNKYASFSIAIKERTKDGSKTTWARAMKVDKEGKLTPYLTKGMKVFVIGRPTISAYINKDKEAVGDLTIWVNELEFGSSAKAENNQQPQQYQQPFPPLPDNDDLPF